MTRCACNEAIKGRLVAGLQCYSNNFNCYIRIFGLFVSSGDIRMLKSNRIFIFFLKPHFSACFLKIFDIKDTYVTMILPITCFAINYCCMLLGNRLIDIHSF